MKSILARITLISFLIIFFIPNLTAAETKTFVREYTYQAGDEDSKNSSRTIALREIKRLLLEELGTYLESETEVQNFQLTKDQITTLTAGIVQTQLVEESWNGRTYWIKAKINANSGDVIKSIDALRKNRVKTKELAEVRKRSDDLLKENERLRKDLTTSKGKKKQKNAVAYNKTIKGLNVAEWFEIGYQAAIAERWKEAVDAFTEAIGLDLKFAAAYANRGIAYRNLGNYNQAITDHNKAIELNPQNADAYVNRGSAYGSLGNYNQALTDLNKAIELNPEEADAYYNFGTAYFSLGNYNQAINNFNKAIELNPQYIEAYRNRGIAYGRLGNENKAITDTKTAARLGHRGAQDFLRRSGIDW